jgi:hypothetical protein
MQTKIVDSETDGEDILDVNLVKNLLKLTSKGSIDPDLRLFF